MSETKDYILTELAGLEMKALSWMNKISELEAEQIDVIELGELSDVLKDLFQTEKYVMEACYYKHKIEEMEGDSTPTVSNVIP